MNIKKIFLVMFMIFLLAVPALANEAIQINVDVAGEHITLGGTSSFINESVTIQVRDSSKRVYIDQLKTDNQGKFCFQFLVDADKEYEGKIRIGDEVKDFTFSTVEDSNPSGGGSNDDSADVYIRVEGYGETIIPRTEINVDMFDLDQYLGEASGSSATNSDGWGEDEFNKPTVAHAIVQVLEDNNIDYDLQDYGWSLYMAMIDDEREFDIKSTSGWLYRVDGVEPNKGCQAYKLSGGEEIIWYFMVNRDAKYTQLSANKTRINPGEEVTFTLKGANSNGSFKDEVEDALIFINGEEYEVNGESLKTDKNGQATIKFEQSGNYEVSAERFDDEGYHDMVRPVPISINVKSQGGGGGGGSNPPSTDTQDDSDNLDDLLNSTNNNTDKVAELAEKSIEKAATKVLNENNIKVTENKMEAKIDLDSISDSAQKAVEKAQELKQELANKQIETNKELKKKVVIEIPKKGTREVTAGLPSGTMDKLLEKGISSLKIKTEVADFSVTPQTFGDEAKGKEITLSAKKLDDSEIPEDLKGKTVIDLGAKVGEENISKFKESIEVSIPYTLAVGEKPEEVTIFLLKDDGTYEAVGGKYDSETGSVKFSTNHFSKYFAKASIKEFADMDKYTWAENAVEIMAGKGIINGRTETKFDPAANITRAEFAALAARMLQYEADETASIPFNDIDENKWYYNAVTAAYDNDLVKGKSETKFDPNGNITRQEMAVIIANVLKRQSYKAADESEINIFNDKTNIAAWAKDSVAMAAREEIINGMGDGSFVPKENANRAQAAVMLYRLFMK